MGDRIKVFLVAAFMAFAINAVTAPRPSYSDSVTVPQVNSNINKESNKLVQDYYLQGINYDRCDVANIKDSIINADVPETLGSMLKDFRKQYDKLPQWQSIYHNFRDGVLNEHSTPEERRNAVVCATLEYLNGILNPLSRLTWKYLDPSFPNVKFVSKDKHKEVVYNKHTGQKIDSGINQGTANAAASLFDPEHHEDIKRFERCGTPTDAERCLASFLLRNQCASADYIKTLLDEIDARARDRTARLFNPDDKVQHLYLDGQNLGDQSRKVPVNDEMLGSCTTTDVVVVEREKDTSQVGVRGWCHCWGKTPPYSGCRKEVGIANMRDVGELVNAMYDISQIYEGVYSYTICVQCGKCFTIAKVGKKWSDTGDEIVDTTIFNKYKEKAGRSIPYHHFEDMLAKARDRLLVIPDGQIVISGICSCKYPDPMKVGFRIPFGDYYVCVFCGRVRLPDNTNAIPLGPTEWELQRGKSAEPFPGFKKHEETGQGLSGL